MSGDVLCRISLARSYAHWYYELGKNYMPTFRVNFFFRKVTILDCIEKCVKRGKLNRSNKHVNLFVYGIHL